MSRKRRSVSNLTRKLIAELKSRGGQCRLSQLGELKVWKASSHSGKPGALKRYVAARARTFRLSHPVQNGEVVSLVRPAQVVQHSLAMRTRASPVRNRKRRLADSDKDLALDGADVGVENINETCSDEELEDVQETCSDEELEEGMVYKESLTPGQIRFSHDSVRPHFRDGTQLRATFLQLHAGELQPGCVPSMRVVRHCGEYVSLSNRRLAVFRLWAMFADPKGDDGADRFKIPVQVVPKPRSFVKKYSTTCEGKHVVIRGTCFEIGTSLSETTMNPFSQNWCVAADLDVAPPRKRRRVARTGGDNKASAVNLENLVPQLDRLAELYEARLLDASEFARAKSLLLGL